MVLQLKSLKVICGCLTPIVFLGACSAQSRDAGKEKSGSQVLQLVADVPLPGPAVRFDYQSLDSENGRLYIAHMNADQLVVFDTQRHQVIANLDGFKRVHGVLAVPALNRVFASVTGGPRVQTFETVVSTFHNVHAAV